MNYGVVAVAGVVLILAISAAVYGMRHSRSTNTDPQDASSIDIETIAPTTEPETELEKQVTVDGIQITGMSRDEARQEILKNYPWGMKVTYGDETYEVSNLMEEKLNGLLDEIYRGEPKENYTLDTSGMEEAVKAQAAAAASKWDKAPKNGSISGYDASSDSFVFEGEAVGLAIDQEKLAADIQKALTSKDFDASITASASEVQPEISIAAAKEKYKTIGTFTTNTTANSKRNTNIRLASQALNGTIVQPGQELSFNETVGERTAAKGYQGAAAYNNGEVVEEIGGGVCQVSTTLYNAVLKAGLKVSVRRSHTFEPSYVTPGQDATVSWGGPDFKFINNSNTAIGIKASYYNQTVTVSVYGIPVLEEGVTYSLESTKVADLDPPAPTYEEDQTLLPDQEVVKSAGSSGSRWETRLIVKKNGEVVSRDVDHTVTYKGHAPVVKRNTSGVVITTAGSESSSESSAETTAAETTAESESSSKAPESTSQAGGQIPDGPGVSGPGQSTTAAPTTAASTTAPTVPDRPKDPVGTGSGGGPGAQGPAESQAPVHETTVPAPPAGPGGVMVEPKPE